MKGMTGNMLELLAYYFVHGGEHSAVQAREAWALDAADELERLHLLVVTGTPASPVPKYTCGVRGSVFIQAVLALPLPQQRWVLDVKVED